METVTQRTGLVRYVMYAFIVVAVVALWSDFLEYQLFAQMRDEVIPSDKIVAAAYANDARQQKVAVVYLLVYAASVILVARWILSANRHARALGAEGMQFTPGWAVGWFFIPIMHLWKPYQAMKELWRASNPIDDWQRSAIPWFFGVWWFLWIAVNILGQIIFRLSFGADGLQDLRDLSMLAQISDILDVPMALALIAVINGVHSRQQLASSTGGISIHPESTTTYPLR